MCEIVVYLRNLSLLRQILNTKKNIKGLLVNHIVDWTRIWRNESVVELTTFHTPFSYSCISVVVLVYTIQLLTFK